MPIHHVTHEPVDISALQEWHHVVNVQQEHTAMQIIKTETPAVQEHTRQLDQDHVLNDKVVRLAQQEHQVVHNAMVVSTVMQTIKIV